MQHRDNPSEAPWVMVDSDGEEDEESSGLALRENDLVALFNQLPIDDVFRLLLKIQRKNGEVMSLSHILVSKQCFCYIYL